MKTKLIIIAILIIGKFAAFTQNNFKNTLSGSVGLGTANEKYGFNTTLMYERFISNKVSLGLGINQLSNHRFINSNISIYYDNTYYSEPNTSDQDLTYNSISSDFSLTYYLIKSEKDQLGLNVGALTNFFQKRFIQFIAKEGELTESHTSIHSVTSWETILLKTGIQYHHFFKNNIGFNLGLLYSWANGTTFVVMAGFTTRF